MKSVERLYEEVELQITRVVLKYLREYAWMDPHELKSAAHLGFMDAVASFNPRRGARFSTWCRAKVANRIKDAVRDKLKKTLTNKTFTQTEEEVMSSVPGRTPVEFDVDGLVARLGKETGEVVLLALDPPLPIRRAAKGKTDDGEVMRKAVMKYLQDGGWSAFRVKSVFREIRRAL